MNLAGHSPTLPTSKLRAPQKTARSPKRPLPDSFQGQMGCSSKKRQTVFSTCSAHCLKNPPLVSRSNPSSLALANSATNPSSSFCSPCFTTPDRKLTAIARPMAARRQGSWQLSSPQMRRPTNRGHEEHGMRIQSPWSSHIPMVIPHLLTLNRYITQEDS